MNLTFIGMSGVGKTHWSSRLAAHGFTCFHCDTLLVAQLRAPDGPAGSSLPEVGRWMGMPDEPGFAEREAQYLACEAEVLRDVIARAEVCTERRQSCVIDTGGSAIYADAELFRQLRRFSIVIYLSIPTAVHRQMLRDYLANPLPLIWNGMFRQAPGETRDEAFARCYTQLIRQRERLYERYSDVTLEYEYHRQPALTAESFVRVLRAAAPRSRAAAW